MQLLVNGSLSHNEIWAERNQDANTKNSISNVFKSSLIILAVKCSTTNYLTPDKTGEKLKYKLVKQDNVCFRRVD